MKTSPFLTSCHLSPNSAITTFFSFSVSATPRLQNSFHHRHFVVHSTLDYCNSLYHNMPTSQITRLQQIQNSRARAVVKAPKSHHSHPMVSALIKITERIEYKLLSVTYTVLTANYSNLHICITSSVQPPLSTRSSSLITLGRPSTSSFLRVTDLFFQRASPPHSPSTMH